MEDRSVEESIRSFRVNVDPWRSAWWEDNIRNRESSWLGVLLVQEPRVTLSGLERVPAKTSDDTMRKFQMG